MAKWYSRVKDMGVAYQGPAIDRSRLPNANLSPKIHSFEFGGKITESLWWGDTSQSPAAAHAYLETRDSAKVLRRCYEALELPGTASDYHFAVTSATSTLWSMRRNDPALYQQIEDLALIDAQILEHGWRDDSELDFRRIGQPSFDTLLDLYTAEGYFEDAALICDRAAALLTTHMSSGEDLAEPFRSEAKELRQLIAELP